MISTIRGDVTNIGDNSIILEVGGVGLKIYVPLLLLKKVDLGDIVRLQTELVVREDSLTLYGFESKEEKDFFILFLGVNGVGPRTAMAAISTLSIDLIKRAVISEQPELFNRIPGVGKKGAQKIFLHLQGRVGDVSPLPDDKAFDVDMEILEALTGLGYSVVEAQAAIQAIPRDAPKELEERLRAALSYFSKY